MTELVLGTVIIGSVYEQQVGEWDEGRGECKYYYPLLVYCCCSSLVCGFCVLSPILHFQGLRPFSVYEATGLHLLNTLSKSHYSDSDIYWAHASLTKEAKVNVLISLQ